MLTDRVIRALKAREKPYKRSDEKGLYLLVKPTGSKYWRLKYRYAGKEKVLALGVYPDVPLAEARDGRGGGATCAQSHGFRDTCVAGCGLQGCARLSARARSTFHSSP